MDLFTLVASLTLDSSKYEKGLDDSERKASSFGDRVKIGLATAAKAGTAAIATASAGVVALTKSAVESYAQYEQLVGGVETLFSNLDGTVSAAPKVLENAANAYKTAGMSANEYMETVTSFSAALVSSLEGDYSKAADISDMAISDMSDNANKMGTSMEAIQNAYQGFAKQNYTMLDNLKLGYGGTKTEMERLLHDATAISGVEYDISSLSDVYEAIHVIQGELGITGTTAKEASETISGSLAMAKAAWSNLITGVADDNANFSELISNFVESASTVAENILPRIGTALQGVGQLVEGLAPVIAEAVPVLVETVLPTLLQSAVSLVTAIGGALLENLPMLIDCGLQFILALSQSLIDNLPTLIPAVVDIVLTIVEKLTEPDMLSQLIDAAIQLIIALAAGLINALPQLIAKAPVIVGNLVMAIIRNAPKLLSAAGQLIGTIVRGIGAGIGKLIAKGREIIGAVKGGIMQKINDAKTWGKDLISNFIGGITAKWQALKDKVSSVAQTVKNFLGFSEPKEGPLSNFHTYAPDMMELFAKGIKDNTHLITDQIGKSFDFGADISNVSSAPAVSGGAENITINVYPSKGMDEKQLARQVAIELQREYTRKVAAL